MVQVGYLVEVYDKLGRKVIWEVVDYHLVEEWVEHEELGLQGFNFNLSDEEREGCVGDDVKEFPYFLILMKLWTEYCEEKLYRTNKKVHEDNGRGGIQYNGQFWKLWRFSRNKFWKNIGCLLSESTFGLRG